MEKIEIDWDIHRLIEAERRGFEEPPYLALRRLLKLPPPSEAPLERRPDGGGLPWSEDGVVIPHGSEARMEYLHGRQIYEGRFQDGHLVVNGRSFDTLSEAASALAVTKNGTKTNLNGWIYWKVKLPGQFRWVSLGEMRASLNRTPG
jgi:hypothetical protein